MSLGNASADETSTWVLMNGAGELTNRFGSTDVVMVTGIPHSDGSLFPAADIYVIPNQDWFGAEGQELVDVSNPDGVPNTVVGFEVIQWPIYIPTLRTGDFDLVIDDNQDGIYEESADSVVGFRSDPGFTVTFTGTVSALDKAQMKADFAAPVQHAAVEAQKILAYVHLFEAFNAVTGKLETAWSLGSLYLDGGFSSVFMLNLGADAVLHYGGKSSGGDLRAWASGELDRAQANLAAGAASILADPPDPNFTTVAPTEPLPVTYDEATADGLYNAFAAASNRTNEAAALEAALLHSIERFDGAAQVNARTYMALQSGAVDDYSRQLVNKLADAASAQASLRQALTDAGLPGTVSTADRDLWATVQARLASTGFVQSELDELRAAGLGDAAIEAWRQEILEVPAAEMPSDVVGSLETASSANSGARQALWDLAVQAANVKDALASGSPPVAEAGSDTSTFEGTSAQLSGAGSYDPEGGAITDYRWDFGDGESATGANVDHTWRDDGTYTVTLTVKNDLGDEASDTITALVANLPPTIDTLTTPSYLATGTDGSFQAHATDPGADDTLTYTWDFGDGTNATGPDVQHTYTSPGSMSGTVTVDDGDGGSQTSGFNIQVVDADPENQPPVAVAAATSPTSGVAPLTVSFDGSGSSDPDGDSLSFHWSYGDGAVGIGGPATAHTFVGPGNYTVTLTVTDPHGAEAQAQVVVAVSSPPPRPPAPQDDHVIANPSASFDVITNDADPDFDVLRIISTSQPEHGTVSCGHFGGCHYRATGDFRGEDNFTYSVADPSGLTATAFVTVQVVDPPSRDQALAANADDLVTPAGTAGTVNVLANDAAGNALHLQDVQIQPAHGAVTCGESGSCTYTPTAGFTGYDGFRYTASDGSRTADAIVRVTVYPAATGWGTDVSGLPIPPAVLPLTSGDSTDWSVAVRGEAITQEIAARLGRPTVDLSLTSGHDLSSLSAAPGWTATTNVGGARLTANADALLGDSTIQALPQPTPPITQGTGGDGHVPIIVGNRVFAFFHHANPTSVTCIDRGTGERCPTYPRTLNVSSSNINGPAAVVGARIYVHVEQDNAVTAPITLQCWDTAQDEGCGLIVVDRIANPDGSYVPRQSASAPVMVNGKIYIAGGTGHLYCVDPATNDRCGTPSIATGLTDTNGMDIVTHDARAYISSLDSKTVTCIDVAKGTFCDGWSEPKDLGGWNLVNERSATGTADGACVSTPTALRCVRDTDPATVVDHGDWRQVEDYYTVTAEAELGTKTFIATFQPGLICWDWTSNAYCTGGSYQNGNIAADINGNTLPSAYGAATDGTCVVGLGDPGLVFTVDPSGSSPCTNLSSGTQPTPIDLRTQRCDGTIGDAAWDVVTVEAGDLGSAGEFASFEVTITDANTGVVLAREDLVGTDGRLDLSDINAHEHPSLLLDARAVSVPGQPAWADANPPRVILSWHADPQAGCLRTIASTPTTCPAPPATVGIQAVTDPGDDTTAVATLPTAGTTTCEGNRAPTANDVNIVTLAGTPVPVGLSGADPDSDSLTFTVATAPTHGSLSGSGASLVYTPAAGYVGTDSFTYTASDGQLTSAAATVAITVEPAPVTSAKAFGRGWFGFAPLRSDFNFWVKHSAKGLNGRFEMSTRCAGRFKSDTITQFDVAGPSAKFSGTGRWNGKSGYSFVVTAEDRTNRRGGKDAISIDIRDPHGRLVYSTPGVTRLSGGSIWVAGS